MIHRHFVWMILDAATGPPVRRGFPFGQAVDESWRLAFFFAPLATARTIDVMALTELLEQIRDYYVERFVEGVNGLQEEGKVATIHEVALRSEDGKVIEEGMLNVGTRVDVIVMRGDDDNEAMMIDTEGMLGFEPIELPWPNSPMKVLFQPFQWNSVLLRLTGVNVDSDFSKLRDWYVEWFQVDEEPEDELLEGVHSITDPEPIGDNAVELVVDMGTATVDAINGLLAALADMGVERVEIGEELDEDDEEEPEA